jgi:NitT/TauT family transport system permease protein
VVWPGESQKVFFIFIACVGFVIFDTTAAVLEVDERFVQTAYTLGASRRDAIFKVLIPLALPALFNSLRLLFGLAFGYIVLAELIDAKFGLGYIIQVAQRRGPREHIYLVLVIITLIAFGIDRSGNPPLAPL